MPDATWKPVIWKDRSPKPIRRADGKVLKSPPPPEPFKIREEPPGEVVINTDERNTVRQVVRIGAEKSIEIKTWEEKKQEVLNDSNERAKTYQYSDDQLDDCIKVDVDVREV